MDNAKFFAAVRDSPFGGRMLQPQVDGVNAIVAAWHQDGDDDAHKLAYVLATAYHETAQTMQPIHERGQRSYFDKYEPGTRLGKALGNTASGDGFKFRGRGFVQLTGRSNYIRAGIALDLPLVTEPDMALSIDVAGRVAVRGMMAGWFTGRKLADYIAADKCDFINARRVINGTDRASTIGLYARAFDTALSA